VIEATTDELLGYLADVIEHAERYGAIVQPPYDAADVAWTREGEYLAMDLEIRPPVDRGARVEITLAERWRPIGADRWELDEYAYELRDFGLDYRRAFHQHDRDDFVRFFGVATHEHCESVMGHPRCDHYAGIPCRDGRDALERLYVIWTAGTKPDCSQLRCLED
jgi:hypothetical protein